MSLSLTRRLVIALHPNHLTVVESGRGWRRPLGEPATFACSEPAADEAAWQPPLAALGAWLGRGKYARAQVEIIVSDSFVRYGVLPWSDAVQKRAELAALARIHFEALYGAAAAGWEIKVDCSAYGSAGIACGLEPALMTALRELCASHGVRLSSLQPYFMRAFNRWRSRIDGDALFAVMDAGQCVLAIRKEGAWHSIRSVRSGLAGDTALPAALIDREILLQGLDMQPAVFLHSLDALDKSALRQAADVILLDLPQAGAGQTAGRSMVWEGAA